MSYRAGIGGSLAKRFGQEPTEPHIVCDICGKTRTVYANKNSFAPGKWLLNGKKAPGGWTGGRRGGIEDGRIDFCPECSDRIEKRRKDRRLI